jgi:hypothetical protein
VLKFVFILCFLFFHFLFFSEFGAAPNLAGPQLLNVLVILNILNNSKYFKGFCFPTFCFYNCFFLFVLICFVFLCLILSLFFLKYLFFLVFLDLLLFLFFLFLFCLHLFVLLLFSSIFLFFWIWRRPKFGGTSTFLKSNNFKNFKYVLIC